MRDSVRGASYSSVCNVLRLWSIYRLEAFLVKSRDYLWLSNLQLIPLVSVVWGLSVVGGIRGKQMTP